MKRWGGLRGARTYCSPSGLSNRMRKAKSCRRHEPCLYSTGADFHPCLEYFSSLMLLLGATLSACGSSSVSVSLSVPVPVSGYGWVVSASEYGVGHHQCLCLCLCLCLCIGMDG